MADDNRSAGDKFADDYHKLRQQGHDHQDAMDKAADLAKQRQIHDQQNKQNNK